MYTACANAAHLAVAARFARVADTAIIESLAAEHARQESNGAAGISDQLMREVAMSPERSSIAELAYQLWLRRGCPEGTDELDWMEAERQLAASEGRSASPPAGETTPSDVAGSAPDSARGGGSMQPDPGAAAMTSPSEQRPSGGIRGRPGGRPTAATSPPENRAQNTRRKKTPEPPVDETDDGPGSAPDDTGEG